MFYLIKRGPKPDFHKAPFHPVVICCHKDVAKSEAGWSGDAACVWTVDQLDGQGWLLMRWAGLDIDYGHIVRTFTLPNSLQTTAIVHERNSEPWTLIKGAIWWSVKKMPPKLQEAGVIYPFDNFTQQKILDDQAALDEARKRFKKTGVHTVILSCSGYGFGRKIPDFWPKPRESGSGHGHRLWKFIN